MKWLNTFLSAAAGAVVGGILVVVIFWHSIFPLDMTERCPECNQPLLIKLVGCEETGAVTTECNHCGAHLQRVTGRLAFPPALCPTCSSVLTDDSNCSLCYPQEAKNPSP